MVSQEQQKHRLGLSGQFAISPVLQEVARSYGIRMERMGGGYYRLRSPGAVDVTETLFPARDQGFDIVNAASLQRVLQFLQQPIGQSARTHEQRVLTHRLLRFMTTGSVRIPGGEGMVRHQYLDGDEHVAVEEGMRLAAAWRGAHEIGGKKNVPGSIPHSRYDPERGLFAFDLHYSDHEEQAQAALRASFAECLRKAGVSEEGGTLYLTGVQIERLCAEIAEKAPELEVLSASVERYEQIKISLANIESRILKGEHAVSLGNVVSAGHIDRPVLESEVVNPLSFDDLLRSTTALTHVSGALRDSWARHHFTSRQKNPLADLMAEVRVLRGVLEHYAARGGTNEAEVEAIVEEFAPVFVFARDVFLSLRDAALRDGNPVDAGFNEIVTVLEALPKSLERDPQYKKLVLSLATSLGLRGPVRNFLGTVNESGKDFFTSMGHFLWEKPGWACAALAIATTLYLSRPDTAGSAEMAKFLSETPENAILLPPDNPGDSPFKPYDFSTLPEEMRQTQNWHRDANPVLWFLNVMKGDWSDPVGTYKHYTIDTFVTGPTNAILNGFDRGAEWLHDHVGMPYDSDNVFMREARGVVQPTSDFFFVANNYQDLTHGFFWANVLGHGFQYGLAGAGLLVVFLVPVVDLGGAAFNGVFNRGQGTRLRQRFMDFTRGDADRLVALDPAPKSNTLRNVWALAAAGAAPVAICTAMNLAGQESAWAEWFAGLAGAGAGRALTGSVFMVYNIVQDQVQNHLLGGASLFISSAASGAVYRHGIQPLYRAAREEAEMVVNHLRQFSPASPPLPEKAL